MTNIYPLIGNFSVVPAADMSSLTAAINVKGDTRKGAPSAGKRAGASVLVDIGDGTYKEAIALGDAANALWQVADGSAQYTPV